MNNDSAYGARDPTKPETPAFTKPLPKRENRGGMLANPVLYARLGTKRPPKKEAR